MLFWGEKSPSFPQARMEESETNRTQKVSDQTKGSGTRGWGSSLAVNYTSNILMTVFILSASNQVSVYQPSWKHTQNLKMKQKENHSLRSLKFQNMIGSYFKKLVWYEWVNETAGHEQIFIFYFNFSCSNVVALTGKFWIVSFLGEGTYLFLSSGACAEIML